MSRAFAGVVGFVLGLAVAVPAVRGASGRRYINLPGRTVDAPFSDAVVVGDTVYLAGRIGVDPKTGKAPADLDEEIRLLLDGVKSVLAETGLTMDDLVTVQVFCPDLALYDRFNAAYRGYFGKEFPARGFHRVGAAAARRPLRDAGDRGAALTVARRP
jgi:enamine deaminase RidA (YjgF/YER057c/UK114 family)